MELHNPPPVTQDDWSYHDEAICLTICLMRHLSKMAEHPRWTRFSIRTPYFKKRINYWSLTLIWSIHSLHMLFEFECIGTLWFSFHCHCCSGISMRCRILANYASNLHYTMRIMFCSRHFYRDASETYSFFKFVLISSIPWEIVGLD